MKTEITIRTRKIRW